MEQQQEPKAKAKRRGRGRPPGSGAFKPTKEQRELVTSMAGLGIPQDDIARLVKNPETGDGISPTTLRESFREELDNGIALVKLKIGTNLLKLTEKSAAAAIFAAKVRLRWRTADRETGAAAGGTPRAQLTDDQLQRRIEALAEKALKAPNGKNVIPFRARKKSEGA